MVNLFQQDTSFIFSSLPQTPLLSITHIIAGYWFPEAYGNSPRLPARLAEKKPLEILLHNLDRLKYSNEIYTEKSQKYGFSPIQYGPLVIPRTKKQQRIQTRKNPYVDGLIFELNLLIHWYLHRIPITADIMEIPKGTRLKEGDKIIADIVNAALNENKTAKQVHNRLDSLKKVGAKWVDWEQYKQPIP